MLYKYQYHIVYWFQYKELTHFGKLLGWDDEPLFWCVCVRERESQRQREHLFSEDKG